MVAAFKSTYDADHRKRISSRGSKGSTEGSGREQSSQQPGPRCCHFQLHLRRGCLKLHVKPSPLLPENKVLPTVGLHPPPVLAGLGHLSLSKSHPYPSSQIIHGKKHSSCHNVSTSLVHGSSRETATEPGETGEPPRGTSTPAAPQRQAARCSQSTLIPSAIWSE